MQKNYFIKGIAIVFTVLLASCATYWKGNYSLNEKLVLRKAQVCENEDDYTSALDFYTAVYNEHKEDGYLNYKMGECYLMQGDVAKAVSYFEAAEAKSSGLDPLYSFRYGQAMQQSGNYKKAAELFDRYKSTAKEADAKFNNIDLHINQVAFAAKAMQSPVNATVVSVGDSINSIYSDGIPNITADGKTLIFASARAEGKGAQDVKDGAYFQDIYGSSWNEKTKKWSKAKLLEGAINTTGHDANTSISPDGTSIFLYRNVQEANYHTGSGDLYVSSKEGNNQWGPAKQVPFMNTDYFEAGACVSADGKKVFFVSERNDVLNKNYGNTDIFMMELKDDGTWTTPFNIGPVVNTPQDEIGLFIHPDSKTLFFASTGHDENMGGYDIFKTTYENGAWSKPVNLGYPINTFRDERHFVMSADGSKGYYTTQMNSARTDLDIYQVNLANYNVLTGESKNVVLLKGSLMDKTLGKPVSSDVFR
ncbi:MAG: tetratricopeptide repeat protein [Bacteroidetes bacterium]|nr:tetratricopeptide repeat protein [Bacteroidota bacterium]